MRALFWKPSRIGRRIEPYTARWIPRQLWIVGQAEWLDEWLADAD